MSTWSKLSRLWLFRIALFKLIPNKTTTARIREEIIEEHRGLIISYDFLFLLKGSFKHTKNLNQSSSVNFKGFLYFN